MVTGALFGIRYKEEEVMRKHGVLWWVFIGWWWWIYALAFRIIRAFIKKAKEPPKSEPQKLVFKVVGVSYRQDAIQSLGTKNPDFAKNRQAIQDEGLLDKWIHEYKFTPQKVELQLEQDNPIDHAAVKVVVDGVHIGYIGVESSAQVHDLIKSDRIKRIACSISGGRKKRYHRDADEKEEIVLERDDFLFYARITITVA